MKTNLILFFLASTALAGAQTFVNYTLTNFAYSSSSLAYTSTVSVTVPTNVIAKMLNYQYSASVSRGELDVQYPGYLIFFPFAG